MEQNKDLSSKVLDGVYTGIVNRLFLQHVYSTQSILKEALKNYFNKNLSEFMLGISENEFTNKFHGGWSFIKNEKLSWLSIAKRPLVYLE
ncbi:11131_t:CDS:2, partial [Ambispora leptoticha]